MKKSIFAVITLLAVMLSLMALTGCKKTADNAGTDQGITTPDLPIEDGGAEEGEATGNTPTLPVNSENGSPIELPEVPF